MSLEEMLADLRKEYLASFPGKISNIESHLNAKSFDLVRDDFHKLKGTGATFGMPEVSKLGELVESLCKSNPPLITEIVPAAIVVLQQIMKARSKNNIHDLESDPNYKNIVAHKA